MNNYFMDNIKKLKVLFILVQKGKGDIIRAFLIKNGVSMTMNFFAEGIKKNYVMDILEDDKNREVIFTIVSDDKYKMIYDFLESRFLFEKSMNGMLLTFNILSMAGTTAYKFLSNFEGVK